MTDFDYSMQKEIQALTAALKTAERDRDEALGGDPYIDALREVAELRAENQRLRELLNRHHESRLLPGPCPVCRRWAKGRQA